MCFVLSIGASDAAADPVQDRLDRFLKQTLTPGIALSAMREGDAAPRNWYAGFSNLELNVPVDARTTFRIGSVTKLFTAAAIEILIEQGKLRLDTTLAPYFPELQGASRITVTDLLDHSSGLPDMLLMEPFQSNMAKAYAPPEILAMVVRNGSLDFEPGRRSEYSNTGYLVLGLLIEKVSGLAYDEFLRQYVTGPLGMRDTQMGSDSVITPGRAAGYAVQKDSAGNPGVARAQCVSIVPPFSTGALLSRPSDFVRLIGLSQMLGVDAAGAMMRSARSPERVKPRSAIPGGPAWSVSFGLGFELIRFGDSPATMAAKDGVIPGFSSWYAYFPEKKLAIAVSTNNEAAVVPLLALIRDMAASF